MTRIFNFISIFVVVFLIVTFYKTVKYICKIVCTKINLFWSSTVWVILTFLSCFWLPVFTSYYPQNTLNVVSDNLIFTISRGSVPPDTPRGLRLRRSFALAPRWIAPSFNQACLRAWIARSYVNTPWKGGEKMESVGAGLQFSFYVIRSAHRRNLSAQNPLGLNKSCRKLQHNFEQCSIRSSSEQCLLWRVVWGERLSTYSFGLREGVTCEFTCKKWGRASIVWFFSEQDYLKTWDHGSMSWK